MNSLRIILILLETPVPFGNAAARWYYVLLRELVARGHKVTCFAACSKQTEMQEALRLFPSPNFDLRVYEVPRRKGWRAKLETLLRPYSYMFSDALKRDLELELQKGFDVLHMEQLWSGWLGLGYREKSLVNVHYLFSIDLSSEFPVGIRERIQRWLMNRGERRLLCSYPKFITLSDRLRDSILAVNPNATAHVVPLALDIDLYPYTPDDRRGIDPIVSVIGSMNWYPTHSAAIRLLTRLWPEIKKHVPEAKLQLVGWGARAALSDYLHLTDVSIKENVPDTRPYFERTTVMLYAPGRGSGMKVKVLESLGYGVPVVTTSEGVEGLPAEDGIHAGICDNDAGLISRTVALLKDTVAQNRMRTAGRELLEAHCKSGVVINNLESVFFRVLN